MFLVNTSTKKFTESASLDLGLLPADGKIDIQLTDGSEPVVAEGKTFAMTIGTIEPTLYKTDDDTVSFRYIHFDDTNVSTTMAITLTMDGVEVLDDTISLTYTEAGGGDPFPQGGLVGDFLQKTENGQTWTEVPDATDYLCFTAAQANSTVRLDKVGSPNAISLEYSTDKANWTTYTWDGTTGTTVTLTNIGDRIWFRGENSGFSTSDSAYYKFVMSGKIDATGNIMSLVDKTCQMLDTTNHEFKSLFYNCSALLSAPKLPALTINSNAYTGMFEGCTSLVIAPKLPALNLNGATYPRMFKGCTALKFPPELPSMTAWGYCYDSMFEGCSSLENAPHLPAVALGANAYQNMFKNCSKLNYVSVACKYANFWDFASSMLSGVSSTGTFVCPSNNPKTGVPANWTVVYNDVYDSDFIKTPAVAGTAGQVLTMGSSSPEWAEIPSELPSATSSDSGKVLTVDSSGSPEWADASKGSDDYFYLTQDVSPFSDTNTIRLNKIVNDYAPANINLEYSFDKTTWTQYGWQGNTGDEISISTYNNRIVYFRGNNATVSPSNANFGNYQFVFTGSKIIKAGGNLMSLLDKKCEASSIPSNCFRGLFKDCTLLTIPPSIKAMHFSDGCKYIFEGCTNLQSIVPMPEDADGTFVGMYFGCSKLTNVKLSVKNVSIGGFQLMFKNCTSLKTVELNADMFYAIACYGMFEGCTALEEAVLGIYKINMSGGYNQFFDRMFFGCTNLKKVSLLNSLFPINAGDWLKNASEHGVFVCPSNTDIPATRNTSGVPEGWTIVYTDDTAVSGTAMNVSTSSDATVELSPSGDVAKQITVSSALTLSASASATTQIAYAEVVLDIASNATVTAGTNLTLVDTPTAGKRNICEVRWSDGVAKLRVKYLEDLPQA